jgi:hypothetical protein
VVRRGALALLINGELVLAIIANFYKKWDRVKVKKFDNLKKRTLFSI